MAMMFISLHTQAEGYRNGVHRDIKEVVKRYRLAAKNGSESAQIRLSFMYYKGEYVPQNYKESAKWCRLAAEQGNTLAQSLLGEIYEQGEGVPQNYVVAYMWASIATSNEASPGGRIAAIKQRDSIATHLTAHQIDEAQQLAIKCTANKFKGC